MKNPTNNPQNLVFDADVVKHSEESEEIQQAERESQERLAAIERPAVHPKNYADLFPSYEQSSGITLESLRLEAPANPRETMRKTLQELKSLIEEVATIYNLRLGRSDKMAAIGLVYSRGFISRWDVHQFFVANNVWNRIQQSSDTTDLASAEMFIDYCTPLIGSMREQIERAKSYLEKWERYAKEKLEAIEKFITATKREAYAKDTTQGVKSQQINDASILRRYFVGVINGFEDLRNLKRPNFDHISFALAHKKEQGLKESYAHGYYAGYFSFGNHPDDVEDFYWVHKFNSLYLDPSFPKNIFLGTAGS